jgi:hypothetical protein
MFPEENQIEEGVEIDVQTADLFLKNWSTSTRSFSWKETDFII